MKYRMRTETARFGVDETVEIPPDAEHVQVTYTEDGRAVVKYLKPIRKVGV